MREVGGGNLKHGVAVEGLKISSKHMLALPTDGDHLTLPGLRDPLEFRSETAIFYISAPNDFACLV